jgi:hypothetical protein
VKIKEKADSNPAQVHLFSQMEDISRVAGRVLFPEPQSPAFLNI